MANQTKSLLAHIRERGLLHAGERVGIAVSGGADSVALLRLLLELREQLGIVLSAVHFNHKLRGAASDKDERFVEALAERFGLPLHLGRGDIEKKAKREKANVEDAGRRARYSFFRKLTDGKIVDRVATAHTAEDQAETVLAHVLRGTGLAGLGGIHPTTADGIVRPLLTSRRAELRKYLRGKKQTWHEDETNRDTSRQRARMRKKLLPLLERDFNPRAIEHIGSLAELARRDEAFLTILAESRCAALSTIRQDGTTIPVAALIRPLSEDLFNTKMEMSNLRALSTRMVQLLVKEQKQAGTELSAAHIEVVLRMAEHGENGKVLQLPSGVDVRRSNDQLVFLPRAARAAKKSASRNFSCEVSLRQPETSVTVKEIGRVFRIGTIDSPGTGRETITNGGVVLDRAKLRETLTLRSAKPGDRLRPTGHQHARKLTRLLNETRVNRWDREGWPVLESGQEIVWARGFVAAEFAATKETKQAILIREEPA